MSTGAISISSERQKSIDYTVTVMELVPGIATPRTNTGKGLSINDIILDPLPSFRNWLTPLPLSAHVLYGWLLT